MSSFSLVEQFLLLDYFHKRSKLETTSLIIDDIKEKGSTTILLKIEKEIKGNNYKELNWEVHPLIIDLFEDHPTEHIVTIFSDFSQKLDSLNEE